MAVSEVSTPRPQVAFTLPVAFVPVLGGLGWTLPLLAFTHGSVRTVGLFAVWGLVAWVQLAAAIVWVGSQLVVARVPQSSTEDVLSRRRRQGWRIAQDATVAEGHGIDHVAIGPGGVVVVETKSRRAVRDDALSWAARQAQQNASAVAGVLGSVIDGAPVRPVVVVWGPEPSAELPAAIDGVRIVRGDELSTWLDTLDPDWLTAPQVRRAWDQLLGQATACDLHERRVRRAAARRRRKAAHAAELIRAA